MKKLLLLLALLFLSNIYSQNGLRFNKTEFFTISTSIDPSSSYKEKGLDIVGEIEYAGSIYIKAGFESFSVLQGGYTDVHWSLGINLTSGYLEQWRYYAGLRTALVFRDSGYAINYGLETGIDYNINDNFFIGLRSTYDYRLEQKVIFNWEPELKLSGFIRIGYRWNFKKY